MRFVGRKFWLFKIGQRHLVREKDVNPVSDYLYESSTDSIIRISVQNLKKISTNPKMTRRH